MSKMKFMAAMILAGVSMMLGGCSGFDAGVYTKAVLDASYKDQTENYIELTEITQEEAGKMFQGRLDVTMEEFKSEQLSEELENNYRSLFETVMKQVNYTVGETVKEEDGSYTVHVAVEPVTLFDDTYQTFQDKAEEYAAQITDSVMNGAEMPTEGEIQEQVYKLYYDILKAGVDAGVKYAEAENVTLHIVKTEAGDYEINKEDLQAMDSKLISRKVMTKDEE